MPPVPSFWIKGPEVSGHKYSMPLTVVKKRFPETSSRREESVGVPAELNFAIRFWVVESLAILGRAFSTIECAGADCGSGLGSSAAKHGKTSVMAANTATAWMKRFTKNLLTCNPSRIASRHVH